MKKIFFRSVKLYLLVLSAMSAMLTGCGGDNGDGVSNTSSESSSTAINAGELTGDISEMNTETRQLEEGDDYAINKIVNRSAEDALPGGYKLQSYSEENQGKFFANGKAKIIIRAYNYKEDLQDLATWADNACAIQKIANITEACDTNYSEPENTELFGFDGIKYNYELIQYRFIPNENDPEAESVKEEAGRYKGIAYFFYSERDAYAIMFDTSEADWDEQSALFEEFMSDLEIK